MKKIMSIGIWKGRLFNGKGVYLMEMPCRIKTLLPFVILGLLNKLEENKEQNTNQ